MGNYRYRVSRGRLLPPQVFFFGLFFMKFEVEEEKSIKVKISGRIIVWYNRTSGRDCKRVPRELEEEEDDDGNYCLECGGGRMQRIQGSGWMDVKVQVLVTRFSVACGIMEPPA